MIVVEAGGVATVVAIAANLLAATAAAKPIPRMDRQELDRTGQLVELEMKRKDPFPLLKPLRLSPSASFVPPHLPSRSKRSRVGCKRVYFPRI